MKRYILSLLACLCGLIALAQTDEPAMRREFDDAFMHPEADSLATDRQRKAPRLADSLRVASLPSGANGLSIPFLPSSTALSPAVPYTSAWASPWDASACSCWRWWRLLPAAPSALRAFWGL